MVFDDMINRSVPLYKTIQQLICNFTLQLATPNSTIIDMGCSTGTTIHQLQGLLNKTHNNQLLGIDSSPEMIKKAQEKCQNNSIKTNFLTNDICNKLNIKDVSVIICNLSLQFISINDRIKCIDNFYKLLNDKGALIIVEKIHQDSEKINQLFKEQYYSLKSDNNYSTEEIKNKESALKDVLIPTSINHYLSILQSVSFTDVSSFFQWNNFCGIIAIK